MPKKDRSEPKPQTEEVFVSLKPVLGVRPGIYLTGIYGIACLLVLFFLLIFPGLRHRGSYLDVSGTPSRATVLVDGRYAGTTPCAIFMKKGNHSVEITRPFFASVSQDLKSPGRVFATLFVPQRHSFRYTLDLVDPTGLFEQNLLDFVHNPGTPDIIVKAVEDAFSVASPVNEAYDFLDKVKYFVTSQDQLRSFMRAAFLVSSRSGSLSISGLLSVVDNFIQLASDYSNSPAWILLCLSKDRSKALLSTRWARDYASQLAKAVDTLRAEEVPAGAGPVSGARLIISGIPFRTIPGGTLLMGRDDTTDAGRSIDQLLPHPVRISRFLLAETEVTNRQFQAFVDSVPEWQPSNRSKLIETGQATDGYLASWNGDRYPAGADEIPVTGVSWHAAVAYCRWLGERAGANAQGAQVRLPSEAEWEWAARGGIRGSGYPSGDKPGASTFYRKDIAGPAPAGSSGPNGYGVSDMAGNVWEWCAESFAPAAYVLTSLDPSVNLRLAARLPASDEKVVRGGSWNNLRELVKVYTRGVQPAQWCTPYLGFRPAMALP